MGWLKNPGPTYLAGRLPAIFLLRRSMKELSIFVDESGDFGEYAVNMYKGEYIMETLQMEVF